MHIDPRVRRDQNFQPTASSFYMRQSHTGRLGVPDSSPVAEKDTETHSKISLRKVDVKASDAMRMRPPGTDVGAQLVPLHKQPQAVNPLEPSHLSACANSTWQGQFLSA